MAPASADELIVQVQRVGEAALVRVSGSAGMVEAGKLRTQLDRLVAQSVPLIVLDLSGLAFISSAGLGAMLSAQAKLRARQGEIRLIHPQPLVLRLLEMTRLTRLFGVFPSLEEALAC